MKITTRAITDTPSLCLILARYSIAISLERMRVIWALKHLGICSLFPSPPVLVGQALYQAFIKNKGIDPKSHDGKFEYILMCSVGRI